MSIPVWVIVILCIVLIKPIFEITCLLICLGFYFVMMTLFAAFVVAPILAIYIAVVLHNYWFLLITFSYVIGIIVYSKQGDKEQSYKEPKKITIRKVRYIKYLKANFPLFFNLFIKKIGKIKLLDD